MPSISLSSKFLKTLQRSLNNKNITIEILNEMKDGPISSNTTNFYKHLESAILTNYKRSKTASVLLPNSNDISLFRQHGIPGYSSIPVQIPDALRYSRWSIQRSKSQTARSSMDSPQYCYLNI